MLPGKRAADAKFGGNVGEENRGGFYFKRKRLGGNQKRNKAQEKLVDFIILPRANDATHVISWNWLSRPEITWIILMADSQNSAWRQPCTTRCQVPHVWLH